MEATTQRRGPAKSASASFDFGAERNAWETVFDDATMRDLNQRLALLPKASRSRRRREIFEAAVPALKNEGALSLATSMVDAQAAVERLRTAMVNLPKVVK
jgi:N-methylhydantoinase B